MKPGFRVVFLAIASVVLGRPLIAQYTNVSPQSTNPVVVFNAKATAGVSSPVVNVGQNVHFLSYTSNASQIQIQIEGSFDCVNYFAISDQGTTPTAAGQHAVISANGWFPCIRANLVSVAVVSGTPSVTATYSGTSSTVPLTGAPYNSGGVYHQTVAVGAVTSANATLTFKFNLPVTASAIVLFEYSSTGCTGSSLNIEAGVPVGAGLSYTQTFTPAATAAVQAFIVPNVVGITAAVVYFPGTGCTGQTMAIDWFGTPAELSSSGGGSTNVNATIVSPLGPNAAAAAVSVTPADGLQVTPTANSFNYGATGCSVFLTGTPCAAMNMGSNNSSIEPIRDNLSAATVGIACSGCSTTQTSSAILNTNGSTMKVFVNVTACSSCNFTPNVQNKDAVSGNFCPIFLTSGAVQPLCAAANNGIAAITATGEYVYTVGPGLPAILGISSNDVPARDLQIVVTWNSGASATYTVAVAFVN